MASRSLWDVRKFQRGFYYTGIYFLLSGLTFAYANFSKRAGVSRAPSLYSEYPAGVDLLFNTSKIYKKALANAFEMEEWGPVEYAIMAKHYERQGQSAYAYHSQYMVHVLSNGQMDITSFS